MSELCDSVDRFRRGASERGAVESSMIRQPTRPISSLSPSFFNYSFTALSLTHESLILRAGSAVSYSCVSERAVNE
jgi:hypothetical protein